MESKSDSTEINDVNVNLGSWSGEIKKKVYAVIKEYDAAIESAGKQEEDSTIDQNIASQLKKEIDSITKSNWHVIVGSKFSISVGLQKDSHYAHYKTNNNRSN